MQNLVKPERVAPPAVTEVTLTFKLKLLGPDAAPICGNHYIIKELKWPYYTACLE